MQWCQTCKKETEQKLIDGNDKGNCEYECLVCKCRNYTIQGFNSNLM